MAGNGGKASSSSLLKVLGFPEVQFIPGFQASVIGRMNTYDVREILAGQ